MNDKKILNNRLSLLVSFYFIAAVSACGCSQELPSASIYQYSTIQALANGAFDGQLDCKKLLEHGNIGLGTFNDLDGEMIVLDGRIYQVRVDGKVASGIDLKTPFAAIFPWPKETPVTSLSHITKVDNLSRFTTELDKAIEFPSSVRPILTTGIDSPYSNLKADKNTFGYFNVLRMDGMFDYLKLRSVPKQSQPYPTLAEAVKKQAVFEHRNIKGTLIGFRCPDSIGGLNVPGWHFHFISDDLKIGGHVLDIAGHDFAAAIIPVQEYQLTLPDTESFRRAATQPVAAGSIQKVEK